MEPLGVLPRMVISDAPLVCHLLFASGILITFTTLSLGVVVVCSSRICGSVRRKGPEIITLKNSAPRRAQLGHSRRIYGHRPHVCRE
ncbi:hypothetical protein LZ32DRAFT_305806 [Colletotrichum eremochloae]|nr:hypothetical protein LZ32DRAFT_305806 [Colletotrichum eremochloae]